uniref:hypothetical protein n=1 Tax=Cereibacter sphaeroides TaxID=1063 RepID=UPI00313D2099
RPHFSLLRPHFSPIGAQAIENERRFSPELIELIEQEGLRPFFVKIWGEEGDPDAPSQRLWLARSC